MPTITFQDAVASVPKWKKRFIRKFQTDLIIQINVLLKEKGISQKELVARTGFQKSYVSRLLSGSENLTLQTIAKIEEAIGAEVLVVPRFADEERTMAMPITYPQHVIPQAHTEATHKQIIAIVNGTLSEDSRGWYTTVESTRVETINEGSMYARA